MPKSLMKCFLLSNTGNSLVLFFIVIFSLTIFNFLLCKTIGNIKMNLHMLVFFCKCGEYVLCIDRCEKSYWLGAYIYQLTY